MKPLRLQYFMASHLGKLAGGVGVVTWVGCVAVNSLLDPAEYFKDMTALFGLLLAMLSAAAAGFVTGYLVLGRILFLICAKVNGGPFEKGDKVRILTGPHRDRVTLVYDVWASHGRVRVALDELSKKDATDVFMYHEICREKDA
jgi:hypothetical protein